MESNLLNNRDNVCRACMMETSDKRALFDEKCLLCTNLGEMLSYITGLELNCDDELPKQICGDCEAMARQFEAFKRRCKESESHFRRLIIPHEKQSDFNRKVRVKREMDDHVVSGQNLCQYSEETPRIVQNSVVFNESCSDAKLEVPDLKEKFLEESKDLISQSIFNSANQNGNDVNDVKEEADYSDDYFSDDILNIPEENDKESVLKLKNERDNSETSVVIKEVSKNVCKEKAKIFNNLVCSCCNIRHKTTKAYSTHMEKTNIQTESKERIHQCSHCMRKFARKNTLAIHLKKHEKQLKKHTCTVCKREFIHRAHLDNHILSVHSKTEGFTCDSCNKSFPTEDSLSLHKDIHKSKKRHQCKHCSKAFSMLSTLRDHLRVHTGEKPYLCPTCGKGFTQNTNLIDHIRRHEGIKPYRCEMCDQRFVSKGELSAHSRKHSGAHPFVCDDCGNGFTTSSSLVKHRRTHTGERPYACDLCPMRFAASGTLKNHRRTHTGEKPYKCTHCEKAFVQKNDLVSHTRCHTGERPYVCSTCGQAFRQGSALKTHLKMHSVKEVHSLNRKEGNLESS